MTFESDTVLGYDAAGNAVMFEDFKKNYYVLSRVKKFTQAGNTIRQRVGIMETFSFCRHNNRLNVRCGR